MRTFTFTRLTPLRPYRPARRRIAGLHFETFSSEALELRLARLLEQGERIAGDVAKYHDWLAEVALQANRAEIDKIEALLAARKASV